MTLAALVAAALILANWRYLFHTRIIEVADLASNSLAVDLAKHFRAIHGNYSRWGFHHPGPAMFYCYALGQALLYNWLHVVPTPYNGEVVGAIVVSASFFAAAVVTASRWISSPHFVPLIVVLAVLHFGATANPELGGMAFLSMWAPSWPIMPFLCLLVAAASVGAGRGSDLPLLVVACGFLVHDHVAQPLFVVPLFALAYAGLVRACPYPWRTYPRAHWVAGAVIAVFLLPLIVDVTHGRSSNLAAILHHLRAHKGEHHDWGDSLRYLTHFAGYAPVNGSLHAGDVAFARTSHMPIAPALLWPVAVFVPAVVLVMRRGRADQRFLRWLCAVLFVAAGLSLFWGTIQDGTLFYFNSYFNYSIFFGIAIAATVAVLPLLAGSSLVPRGGARLRAASAGALWVLAGALFLLEIEKFRTHLFDDDDSRSSAATVEHILQEESSPAGTIKFLSFPHDAWGAAVATALQMERRGCDTRVVRLWGVIFGESRELADPVDTMSKRDAPAVWRIRRLAADPASAHLPLGEGYGLVVGSATIDPALTTEIPLDDKHDDIGAYALFGWGNVADGFVWSDLPAAMMRFRAAPIAPDAYVDLTVDLFPYLVPGKRESQRLEIAINGSEVGAWQLTQAATLHVTLPASAWNAEPEALLVFRFPDAVSPASLGLSGDPRPFGFGFRKLLFRVHPSSAVRE